MKLWNLFFVFLTCIAILTYMNEPFTEMYYITIATKPHPVLDKIQDKLRLESQKLHVLGLEEKRDIGWNKTGNFGIKLREVYRFLQNTHLRNSDIILFTDAYDVAVIGTQKEIVKRYKEFHSPIVFGGEKFCHPDKERASQYKTKGAFPYLNSGLFIGRVWALRQCMAGYSFQDAEDDQRYWTNKYFSTNLITIDTNAKLFLNCAGLDKKAILYDRFRRICFNKETETRPLIVHANGSDKSYLYSFIGRWPNAS